MTRPEWRNVLLLALVVAILTTAPYVLAWAQQGDSWHFSGFLFGVEDGNSYLGKMRLGARGEWAFTLFYTPEAHDPAPLVFLPYILTGQIVGALTDASGAALTQSLIVAFHLMRVIFDALLVAAIYRFAAAFLAAPRARLIATIFALFGGGLGWLLSLAGANALPADFYIPEGFSFLILFGLPHLALARAALLFGLLALIRALPVSPAMVMPSAPQRRWIILAGVCWLVVGLCVSFYLAILYCILGAWGLAAWIKQRRFPVALFVRAVIAAALTLPLFAYYALAFTQNPVFAAWSAQNLLPSPPPLQYLFAYLPLGLLALFGIRRMWVGADFRQTAGLRPALLLGWLAIVPLLVYLPINVQRRMSEAVIVPLAILAAAGLHALADRLPRPALVPLFVLPLLTSAFLLLGGFLAAMNPARPLFRPAAEVAAFDWLDAHAQPGEIVLSAVETGNVLPAWTHLRTYMGHGPETVNWQHKTARLQAFYAGRMSAAERADFLAHPCAQPLPCAGEIRYVIWGALERAYAPDSANPPAWASGMTAVYDSDGYTIFRTND